MSHPQLLTCDNVSAEAVSYVQCQQWRSNFKTKAICLASSISPTHSKLGSIFEKLQECSPMEERPFDYVSESEEVSKFSHNYSSSVGALNNRSNLPSAGIEPNHLVEYLLQVQISKKTANLFFKPCPKCDIGESLLSCAICEDTFLNESLALEHVIILHGQAFPVSLSPSLETVD